jgi:transposase
MEDRNGSTPTVGADIATVFVAIELSMKSWLVAVQSPRQQRPGRHTLAPADAVGLWRIIERERATLLARGYRAVRVVSCYEAGRDGFWLHRFLTEREVESRVVDPGSVLVNRRARRAKSDRLDVEKLLRLLIHYEAGDRHLGRMVVVPSVAEEDARRPGRERGRLMSERNGHANRIQGLVATHGIYGYQPLRADRWERLAQLRCADGQPLPRHLRAEIGRELERLELVQKQILAVEKERGAALAEAGPTDPAVAKVAALMQLKGIGIESATLLVREVLFRQFASRRHVASFFGLTTSKYLSGGIDRDQGISKAGNRRARGAAMELAWLWLWHQPDSALSRWFRARLASPSPRLKRVLIVALARKLMVALWRYVTTGLVPEGARLKSA